MNDETKLITVGEKTYKILEIKSSGSKYLPPMWELYRNSFDDYELSEPKIFEDLIDKQGAKEDDLILHFWAIVDNNDVIGMSIFNYVISRNLGYIAYLSVTPSKRSAGLGSAIFKKIVDQVNLDARSNSDEPPIGICLEMNREENCQEKETCRRRQRFYEKNGSFKILDYSLITPMGANDSIRYDLMFYPIMTRNISASLLTDIVTFILIDWYELNKENSIYKRAIKEVEDLYKNLGVDGIGPSTTAL